MLTIMRTSTFLNAIDDAYSKGVAAGSAAEAIKDREDQNRRLEDMLHFGKESGHKEGYFEGYKDGYKVGYAKAEEDVRAEIGEIDLSDLEDDVSEALEDE